ncbi:MAG: hypothetical protein ACK5VX_16875, partial [Akkermansiaceae bacterium]
MLNFLQTFQEYFFGDTELHKWGNIAMSWDEFLFSPCLGKLSVTRNPEIFQSYRKMWVGIC